MRNWPLLITALLAPVYWFLLSRLVWWGQRITTAADSNRVAVSPTAYLVEVLIATLLLLGLTFAILHGLRAAVAAEHAV